MKKNIFFALFVMFVLTACHQPTLEVLTPTTIPTTPEAPMTPDEPNTPTVPGYAILTADGYRYVKNSKWEAVPLSDLVVKSTARAADTVITEGDLAAIVEKLNSSENDNQYFIETTDTDVTESPTINIYIVNEANPTDGSEPWSLLKSYIGWSRADFAARPDAWRMEAECLGGILFVDKIPPKPEPIVDTRTEHEKNQLTIYSVNTGKIIYAENCLDIYDGTNYASLAQCYEYRYNAYKTESEAHNVMTIYADDQWVFLAGHYYTEPAE